MDQSLDDIVASNKRGNGNGGRNRDGGSRRRERPDYPRDGVRKSYREDAPRHLDSEWVHDRFEESGSTRQRQPRGGRPREDEPENSQGTKIRVDNVHYELSQSDLEGLFKRIGPILKLNIRYDRAGRSTGTAFVTYESYDDAQRAVDEFDGANANRQPIRLAIIPSGPTPRARNPFDTAVMPGRPLDERITMPSGRSRSDSPGARDRDNAAARSKGIDRYVPGERQTRSRSPLRNPRREGGRRPGARREERGGGRGGNGGRGGRGEGNGSGAGGERRGREGRPRKTAEDLDAEMADYFGGSASIADPPAAESTTEAAAAPSQDDDMIM